MLRWLGSQMLGIYQKLGAEGHSFALIVSFGAHAADPHHEPDDTVLQPGDASAANTDHVELGRIFSCEPGIYLSGSFGVRIEDLCLITEDGVRLLNHYPKELDIIDPV